MSAVLGTFDDKSVQRLTKSPLANRLPSNEVQVSPRINSGVQPIFLKITIKANGSSDRNR